MRRRMVLLAPLLAGCSVLPDRAYQPRRDWPMAVRRLSAPRAAHGRLTLLVRAITAGPGLEARGLLSIQLDGSLRGDYYEQWVVPPAQAVEAALRQWLAASGLFAGVLAPGSRAPADLVLEGELTALATGPDQAAHAALSFALLDERSGPVRVLGQESVSGTAVLAAADPAARVAAMQEALAAVFRQIEVLGGTMSSRRGD